MRTKRSAFIVIFALSLLMLVVPTAAAQGFVPDDPPPPGQFPPTFGPITIELHSVDAVVDGPVATVHVTQVFRNQADRQVEGIYIFPLPPDAAVSDFQMTVDGQVLEGEVLPKDEARRIYEEIVRRRRDPALLEYLGRDLFQTSVFPIPPGESRKLKLTYTQVLPIEQGLYHLRYPLQTRQYSAAPVGTLALRVELRNQPGLRTIYSPSHDISIDRIGDDAALIGYEASFVQPERDFDLYFGVSEEAIGLNLLSYKPAGEDGFFLLLATPGIDVAPDEIVERDIILVLDVSGSMEGPKLAQAKDAAYYLVDHLNAGDRFNLIAFSTGARLWSERLKELSPENIDRAHADISRLRASGSTDINRALLEAIGQLDAGTEDGKRPAYILFMTDGLPTQGETNSDRIVANALNNMPAGRNVRLFSFGVGYDVDTDLLDTLSSELGGRSTYVKPDERIDEAVSSFYEQISTPVLTDVKVDFAGMLVDDTYPYPLPDLFAGEQLLLAGRYQKGGDTIVTLRGVLNGEEQVYEYRDQRLVEAGGEPQVARLWATRKIGALLQQIRRQGANQELVDTIVDLSTTYGIVTPYTSYLVLEPQFQARVAVEDAAEYVAAIPMPTQAPAPPREVQATVEVEKMVEMAASGAGAVAASEARSALSSADRAAEYRGTRYVGGKSFTFQQPVLGADGQQYELWVDNQYRQEMPLRSVVFGSDAYFELAEREDVAAWLSVSPELVVVIDDVAYRITMNPAAEGDPTPVPLPTSEPESPTPEPTPGLWKSIWNWLDQLSLLGR